MTKTDVPVIVLAGGRSTRFGSDKASHVLAGKPLLQHVLDATAEVASRFVVVKAHEQVVPKLDTPVSCDFVEDVYPQTGPLGGIFTGLQHLYPQANAEPGVALVVACDMPILRPALLCGLLERREGYDAVVPVRNALPEPLCAAYTARCIEPAKRLLERGDYKVSGLLKQVNAILVSEEQWRPLDPEGRSFLNVNRPEDLAGVAAILATPPEPARD